MTKKRLADFIEMRDPGRYDRAKKGARWFNASLGLMFVSKGDGEWKIDAGFERSLPPDSGRRYPMYLYNLPGSMADLIDAERGGREPTESPKGNPGLDDIVLTAPDGLVVEAPSSRIKGDLFVEGLAKVDGTLEVQDALADGRQPALFSGGYGPPFDSYSIPDGTIWHNKADDSFHIRTDEGTWVALGGPAGGDSADGSAGLKSYVDERLASLSTALVRLSGESAEELHELEARLSVFTKQVEKLDREKKEFEKHWREVLASNVRVIKRVAALERESMETIEVEPVPLAQVLRDASDRVGKLTEAEKRLDEAIWPVLDNHEALGRAGGFYDLSTLASDLNQRVMMEDAVASSLRWCESRTKWFANVRYWVRVVESAGVFVVQRNRFVFQVSDPPESALTLDGERRGS